MKITKKELRSIIDEATGGRYRSYDNDDDLAFDEIADRDDYVNRALRDDDGWSGRSDIAYAAERSWNSSYHKSALGSDIDNRALRQAAIDSLAYGGQSQSPKNIRAAMLHLKKNFPGKY